MDPPFPSSASAPATPATDRGFYRPAWRVGLLGFLAPGAYELWWLWQLQRAANAYQEAGYPGRQAGGMTTGEVIATVIGVIIFAFACLGAVAGG